MPTRDLVSTGYRTPPDLDLAARLLWEPIPKPYEPPPKPRKSWKGLAAGRLLKLRGPWFDGHRRWPAGAVFEVQSPTSAGIQLRAQLTGPTEDATFSAPWTQPDWKASFETVRRPSKKRAKEDNTK